MLETNYKYNVLNSQQFYVDECEPIVHEHQQVRMRLTCECLPSGASLCPYCGWLSRSEAMGWFHRLQESREDGSAATLASAVGHVRLCHHCSQGPGIRVGQRTGSGRKSCVSEVVC